MKERTGYIATSRGRQDRWEPWDLELARWQANGTTRPWGVLGPVPHQRWSRRTRVEPDERDRFRKTCARLREAVVAEKGLPVGQLQNEWTAR